MGISSVGIADESKYAIATGMKDKERLVILNEIYNSSSLIFFQDCNIPKGARVLELGCGIGLMSQCFALAVGDNGYVLATDISEDQLQLARSLLPKESISNLEFRQLSAFEIDTLNQQFDVICARFLLVHLQNPQQLIQKIKKILKPGGKLIIEDITSNDTFYSFPHVKGMEALHHLDKLQCEIQKSDDKYFASFPDMLQKEGFTIFSIRKTQPKLDTPTKRKSILFHLLSLKDTLITNKKMNEEECSQIYQKIQELEQTPSIEIYYYELGQICGIF